MQPQSVVATLNPPQVECGRGDQDYHRQCYYCIQAQGRPVVNSLEILRRVEAQPPQNKSLSCDDRNVLDAEIDKMLKAITDCVTFELAGPLLHELSAIQEVLATLAFKHGIQLSVRQRDIVRTYDRCDIPEVRRSVFQKIKNAEFPYC